MLKRTSTAHWTGNGMEGKGALSTQSGVFHDQPYSFQTRFVSEDGKAGTNPEELIAAAHAGCFAMACAFGFAAAGHAPTDLKVASQVFLDREGQNFFIAKVDVTLDAKIAGIDEAKFQEIAAATKAGCPISRVLSCPINLTAKLLP